MEIPVVVIVGSSFTVIVETAEVAEPLRFRASTLNEYEPPSVTCPEMVPVSEFSETPVGRVPLIEYVIPLPVTVGVCEIVSPSTALWP